jgi:hypothetical protein
MMSTINLSAEPEAVTQPAMHYVFLEKPVIYQPLRKERGRRLRSLRARSPHQARS